MLAHHPSNDPPRQRNNAGAATIEWLLVAALLTGAAIASRGALYPVIQALVIAVLDGLRTVAP